MLAMLADRVDRVVRVPPVNAGTVGAAGDVELAVGWATMVNAVDSSDPGPVVAVPGS